MKTIDPPPAIPAGDLAALEDAVADLIEGIRDPKKSDEAVRELEEGREEIRRRMGVVDLSAELADPDE